MTSEDIRISEVLRVAGRLVLKLEGVTGDLATGAVLRSATGLILVVKGVAFSPPLAWSQGTRLVTVALQSAKEPEPGDLLRAVPDATDPSARSPDSECRLGGAPRTGNPLTGLFYCIQFERNPSDAIDRIVNDLVAKGKIGQTAAELVAAIDATLASGISLPELDMSPARALDEETLRSFLVALRHRLQATDSSVPE